MFRTVIAAINDGPAARDAIALAGDLIDAGGDLALANVALGDARPGHRASATSQASRRLCSLELIEAAAAQAGVTATPLTSVARSVGRGLHELAEREHCDLLVVGSSSRALFDRVVIGDDTRDALNGAPCAVAIAPPGYAGTPRKCARSRRLRRLARKRRRARSRSHSGSTTGRTDLGFRGRQHPRRHARRLRKRVR
jgi:nucleotide-binding universal stress UspA family protein